MRLFSCYHSLTVLSKQAKDGKLSYQGNSTFYADKPPKGQVQSSVYASQAEHLVELQITWKSTH